MCPRCKEVFPSKNYTIGSSRFYSRDNEETCPNCGFEHAKLSDGLFDLTDKTVRILSAPDVTYAMLVAIRDIAQKVSEETITPEAAITQFQLINPKLAKLAKKALRISETALMFVAAAATIASCFLTQQQVEIGKEQLRLQAEANRSSDIALEKTLEVLKGIRFTLEKTSPDQPRVSAQSSNAHEKPQRRPKARELRKKPKRRDAR
jgi:hypothetical protein